MATVKSFESYEQMSRDEALSLIGHLSQDQWIPIGLDVIFTSGGVHRPDSERIYDWSAATPEQKVGLTEWAKEVVGSIAADEVVSLVFRKIG